MVRMGIHVWASSPSHRRRRLVARLVVLIGHGVEVRREVPGGGNTKQGNDQVVDRKV